MTRLRASRRRWLAPLAGLAIAFVLVLAIEGAVGWWTGTPLLRRVLDPTATFRLDWDDRQRARLANTTAGPFDLDVDPEVGHRVKPDNTFAWVSVPSHTDAFGMRVRPAGWPEPDQPRWVVLGDSVAFGLGVADDQTYAARLEAHVAARWQGSGPPPAVLTVAAPGWNLASSTRWLRNHLDRYAPELVVLLPVDNDLENRFVPTSSGGRGDWIDPWLGSRELVVASETFTALRVAMTGKASLAHLTSVAADGGLDAVEHVLTAGQAPESQRRYGAAVAAIEALQNELQRRGARLFELSAWDSHFQRQLVQRLHRAAPELPCGFVLDRWQPSDALVGDPHPNAACVDAGALRALQLLRRHGVVPATLVHEPIEVPEPFHARLVDDHEPAAAATWLAARADLLAKYTGPRIDLRDSTGFQQIYGGVLADGTIGHQARFALRSDGGARELALTLLPPLGGARPQELRLAVACADRAGAGDRELGSVPVPWTANGDAVVVRVALPADLDTKGWFDVHLRCSDHRVEVVGGTSRLAACRLVAAECVR